MQMPLLTFNITGWKNFSEKERYVKMSEFAANGAEHIVLGHDALKLMTGDYSAAEQIQNQMKAAGLDFCDAHAPFGEQGDLFTPDERNRRRMVARQKLNLQLVQEMGVKTCTFHVGSKYFPEHTLDEHREAFFRSLDELLPLAEQLDVTMCLENLIRPLSTADELISYMRKYDSPHLGLCLDVGHANLKEQGALHPDSVVPPVWTLAGLPTQWESDIAERLQPYIVTCHIHDNHGATDEHLPPGWGNINWKRIIPILLNAPRLKCIQSEAYTTHTSVRALTSSFHALFDTAG